MNYNITPYKLGKSIARIIETSECEIMAEYTPKDGSHEWEIYTINDNMIVIEEHQQHIKVEIPYQIKNDMRIFNHATFISAINTLFKDASKYMMNVMLEHIKGNYYEKHALRKKQMREYMKRRRA